MSDLEPRALELLAESDTLELHASPGQLEAFLDAREAAQGRRSLTVEDLCAWQRLITGTVELRDPEALGRWLAELNAALAPIGRFESDVVVAQLLGDHVHHFLELNPFGGGDGRVGRLVLNYIATWCQRPLIVVRAAERAALDAARSSALAMRCWMAEKLRETTVDLLREGAVLERTRIGSNADLYARPGGGELIIERHDLLAACTRWQAASQPR